MEDLWVKYVNSSHEVGELIPILDSMIYAEELEQFPEDFVFEDEPNLFLFFGGGSYFVLWNWDDGLVLFNAGKTLKEVYIGLKNHWHWESCEDDSNNKWIYEPNSNAMDYEFCFPEYFRKSNGRFRIGGQCYPRSGHEILYRINFSSNG